MYGISSLEGHFKFVAPPHPTTAGGGGRGDAGGRNGVGGGQ